MAFCFTTLYRRSLGYGASLATIGLVALEGCGGDAGEEISRVERAEQPTIYGPEVGVSPSSTTPISTCVVLATPVPGETPQQKAQREATLQQLGCLTDKLFLGVVYDDRRNVWDEQRPGLRLDADPSELVRGWSWLRSYAHQGTAVTVVRDAFDYSGTQVVFKGGNLKDSLTPRVYYTGVWLPLSGKWESLPEESHVCDGQRFVFESSPSTSIVRKAVVCSTTLIDDQIVVTAGHCIESLPQRPPVRQPKSCSSDAQCDCTSDPGYAAAASSCTNGRCIEDFCNANGYIGEQCANGTCSGCSYGTTVCRGEDHPQRPAYECTPANVCKPGANKLMTNPSDLVVVFNYFHSAFNSPAVITADDVFELDPVTPVLAHSDFTASYANDDFVVLKLARPATPRFQPVPVIQDRTALYPKGQAPTVGKPVAIIGSPSSLPLKISPGSVDAASNIPAIHDNMKFASKIDHTFGNSGSGTYDLETHRLIGVLNGGDSDYMRSDLSDPKSCSVPVYCTPNDTSPYCSRPTSQTTSIPGFTSHTRMNHILDDLCFDIDPTTGNRIDVGNISPRLCRPQASNTPVPSLPPCLAAVLKPNLEFKHGRELTLYGDTTNFVDDTFLSPSTPVLNCNLPTSAAKRAYYHFVIDHQTMFYADTFGSEFDTILSVVPDLPCLLGTDATTIHACNDDSECNTASRPADWYESQLTKRLVPGSYFLVVSGYNGAVGKYTLHIQTLPDSYLAREGALIPGHAYDFSDSTASYSTSGASSTCSTFDAPDLAYFGTTCPDYQAGEIFANTCNSSSNPSATTWDTMILVKQGNNFAEPCQDDVKSPPLCTLQSQISAETSSGSGVRAVYVDGWSPKDKGDYTLSVYLQ